MKGPSADRQSPPLVSVVGACLLAFFILGSYELVRSPIDSFFVAEHGTESLPKVWILVAAGAIATTSAYNRFAAVTPIMNVLRACIVASAGLLGLLLLGAPFSGAAFAYLLYLWKDIYIVVLVEAFWTLANATFGAGTAKWVYGVFCASGSLGGMAANAVGGQIALRWGTETEMWTAIPVLILSVGLTLFFRAPTEPRADADDKPRPSFGKGLTAVRDSRVLVLMLIMVLSVQLVVTLVDFQFQAAAETVFADTDARTAALHRVYFWISAGALTMQLLSGVVLSLAGVAGTLLAIPAIIAATVVGMLLSPAFAVAALAKVLGKVMDYSIFRTAKEVLYIGLSRAERTEGKAVVDILTYRVAKGGASLLLQVLILIGALHTTSWLALIFVCCWLGAAVGLVRWRRATEESSA